MISVNDSRPDPKVMHTFGDLILAASELTLSTGYDVAINEFFTRAASGTSVPDYVELVNFGDDDVDLTGWTLMGEELSGTITAGGYILVAGEDPFFNEDADELFAGEDIDNSVMADISLGSNSDEIDLLDASGNEVDYIAYGDGWPVGNANRGHAVELNSPLNDNSDPMNWSSAGMDCMSDILYGEDGSDEDLENFGSPNMMNCNYDDGLSSSNQPNEPSYTFTNGCAVSPKIRPSI